MELPIQYSCPQGISLGLSDMTVGNSEQVHSILECFATSAEPVYLTYTSYDNRLMSECLTSSSEVHGYGIAAREKAIALLEIGYEMRQNNFVLMARFFKKGTEILDELYVDSGHPLLA